jgi:hypothetical protein
MLSGWYRKTKGQNPQMVSGEAVRIMTSSNLWTLDAIRARLDELRVLGYTWEQIAAMSEFGGSSAGLLCSILGGYEPKTDKTRRRLGLPPKSIPVEPCGNCNEVHVVGWCVKIDGDPVKPKHPKPAPAKKRKATKQYKYFKCRQDDIEQVVKQLEKYWPGEFIRKG